jgi:hypothetical protein
MKTYSLTLILAFLFSNISSTMAKASDTIFTMQPFSSPREDTTKIKLSGTYSLKFSNTLPKRKWVKATSVGLDFFYNTYLYSTANLLFDTTIKKVFLSSESYYDNLPASQFGSYPYKVNSNSLTIIYNHADNYGKFKIITLNNHWLILEDKRTKTQWKFYKK